MKVNTKIELTTKTGEFEGKPYTTRLLVIEPFPGAKATIKLKVNETEKSLLDLVINELNSIPTIEKK